jgi:hypothetical protein
MVLKELLEKENQEHKNTGKMNLQNLLRSNGIDRLLADHLYIERIKKLYPDYQVFIPVSDPDFLIFRKKVGQSTFGVKPNIFTVDITADIKIHYTELHKIT